MSPLTLYPYAAGKKHFGTPTWSEKRYKRSLVGLFDGNKMIIHDDRMIMMVMMMIIMLMIMMIENDGDDDDDDDDDYDDHNNDDDDDADKNDGDR